MDMVSMDGCCSARVIIGFDNSNGSGTANINPYRIEALSEFNSTKEKMVRYLKKAIRSAKKENASILLAITSPEQPIINEILTELKFICSDPIKRGRGRVLLNRYKPVYYQKRTREQMEAECDRLNGVW